MLTMLETIAYWVLGRLLAWLAERLIRWQFRKAGLA